MQRQLPRRTERAPEPGEKSHVPIGFEADPPRARLIAQRQFQRPVALVRSKRAIDQQRPGGTGVQIEIACRHREVNASGRRVAHVYPDRLHHVTASKPGVRCCLPPRHTHDRKRRRRAGPHLIARDDQVCADRDQQQRPERYQCVEKPVWKASHVRQQQQHAQRDQEVGESKSGTIPARFNQYGRLQ